MVDLFCGPNLPSGKAFLYCGWRCLPVRPMTSPTRSDRSPSGNSFRMQFSRQLLWIAAPSRGPDGIWATASPAPARCGATATLRAFQICPWRTSFASPSTIWLAALSSPSSRPWQTEVGEAFGKTRCVDPGEANDGYRALAGHRLLSMLLYGGQVQGPAPAPQH